MMSTLPCRCLRTTSSFGAPSCSRPTAVGDAVTPLLYAVSQVFHDFRYVREIGNPDARDHALLFQARIGGKRIEGCDFLHSNDTGSIDELVVMIRPLSGVLALAEAMKAQLGTASSEDRA